MNSPHLPIPHPAIQVMPHHKEPKWLNRPGLEGICCQNKIECLQMEEQCFIFKEKEHYAQQCPKKAEAKKTKGAPHKGKFKRLCQLRTKGEHCPCKQNCLRAEGRCFLCKETGHLWQACPKEGMVDDEDLETVVEELSQTWKENGYGNIYVTRQGQDGQQE